MSIPRLSVLLGRSPTFWSFDELITVSNILYLLQHDLFKIHKMLEDIIEHLDITIELFEAAFRYENLNDLEWIYEGKGELIQIMRNAESINVMLSRLLTVLDEHQNKTELEEKKIDTLLQYFENASNMLLDVKKYNIIFKKRLDVAINIKDIESVITSISKEVITCLQQMTEMEIEYRKHIQIEESNFDLALLVDKLKPGFEASFMPDNLYPIWSDIQTQVKPLKVSLEFLPLRMEELDQVISHSFSDKHFVGEPRDILETMYKKLMDQWNRLLEVMDTIKRGILQHKWRTIFDFIISKVTELCRELQLQVKSSFTTSGMQPNKLNIGAQYRLCCNAIKIINRAFAEGIIVNYSDLIISFNEELITSWNSLNDEISRMSDFVITLPGLFTNKDITNLRPYQITRKSNSPVPEASHFNGSENNGGSGITLGLAISLFDSSNVPFSVVQNERVKDFLSGEEYQPQLKVNKRRVKDLLKLVAAEEDPNSSNTATNSDVVTSQFTSSDTVNNSTGSISEELEHESNTKRKGKDADTWQYLFEHNTGESSRIPVILAFYLENGFPKVAKKVLEGTKIPVLSKKWAAAKRAANSLDPPIRIKRSGLENELDSKISIHQSRRVSSFSQYSQYLSRLSSGSQDLPRRVSMTSFEDDHVFRKPSGRSSIIELLLIPRTSTIPGTPPLVADSPHWRSTSPDRPPSSMGSRYEDTHLIKLLKSPKPAWK